MSFVVERPLPVLAPVSVDADLHDTRNTGVRPVNDTDDPQKGVPRRSIEVRALVLW